MKNDKADNGHQLATTKARKPATDKTVAAIRELTRQVKRIADALEVQMAMGM